MNEFEKLYQALNSSESEMSLNSTEEIVCSPEFPDGCIDLEQ
ncbi:hypothetical protein [Scatolibacter rhodanostii]|nr:hypothetical protein [Scatolibacter rhodanostii]